MNTIQLIHYIASHPEFTNIVISDMDDKTPMNAIECLSSETYDNVWAINGTLEKNTLLVYDKSIR
jgi:hypothetical protein